ncbi:hypothetical protein GUJ93_ZPchr0007g5826 [Zizania palustris]|uniref:NB-ARC domain-containing protein n=1 Tax=Zizania palustris TaxID=103762 RepID=A0A8J5SPX5_ZIZPA|nr:hypothetical protein GUJ93_ZPchr0007g5826 [Zizania palustris]
MAAGSICSGRRAARAATAVLWSRRQQWSLLQLEFLPPRLAGRAVELCRVAAGAPALRVDLVLTRLSSIHNSSPWRPPSSAVLCDVISRSTSFQLTDSDRYHCLLEAAGCEGESATIILGSSATTCLIVSNTKSSQRNLKNEDSSIRRGRYSRAATYVARYPLWAEGTRDAATAMRSTARLSRMLPAAADADLPPGPLAWRSGARPQRRHLRRVGMRADTACCTAQQGRALLPGQHDVVGDLVSRSISFFIDKLYRHKVSRGEDLQCLQRLLQRIETVVLEAEGRHITNQAMLRQLQMLREGMYKGYYLVDAIKHRINDEVGDHSFSFPKQRQTKRLCFSSRTFTMAFQGEDKEEVGKMLGSLQSIIDDMKEFVVFLKGYPHIYRQPYSQHLVLDKCIFGRQAEIERIINFLLKEPLGAESLAVLPIIGPARVGKSTLVEHVCYNERVRGFFSSIVFCTGNDIGSKNFSDLSHSGVIKHRSCVADERSLIIIEFLEDGYLEEENWRRLYSSRSCLPHGSKIIVTSRSERFMEVGTTQPLVLNFLPHEAFWYFFKVIAFGSTNPEEHPFLVSAAMEMAGLDPPLVLWLDAIAWYNSKSPTTGIAYLPKVKGKGRRRWEQVQRATK